MNIPRSNIDRCPAENICQVTSENGLPCGEDPAHLQPSITAEALCTRALAGKVRLEIATIKTIEDELPARLAEHDTIIAWCQLERGLAVSDGVEAAGYFDSALEYADRAMHNPHSWFSDQLSAATLHLYRPAFMARRESAVLSSHELITFRQGLGILHDALHTAPVHVPQAQHILDALAEGQLHKPCLPGEGSRKGLATRLVGMMLAARQNIFLYPASSREAYGSGELMAQNHDAYVLHSGEKTRVKIRAKGQSVISRAVKYDDQTVYVNVSKLINETWERMRSKQDPLYKKPRERYREPPSVIEVGHLLRREMAGASLDNASLALLENITAEFERLVQPGKEASDYSAADKLSHNESLTPTVSSWEMLPAAILKSQQDLEKKDDPQKLRTAIKARERYLRYGSSPPYPEDLEQLISDMREVKEPYILVRCAGAYIDLARSSHIAQAHAVRLVEASLALTSTFAAKRWHEVPPYTIDLLHRCQLERAYAGKYKKTFCGEHPNLDDEARLYLDLLEVGRDTLEPAVVLDEYNRDNVRGVQFEIGIHILNARLNLRNNSVVQCMWPSLPREDSPHDFSFEYLNGWDVAVTTGDFLNQDLSCRYLQLKSVDNKAAYNPAITIVRGKEDLCMTTTADVITMALQELDTHSPARAAKAKAKLDHYEQLFMKRLWRP